MTANDREHPSNALASEYLFIDTSTYVALQLDWDGRLLGQLASYCEASILKLLTTDITIREVKARLRERVEEASQALQKHGTILRQLGHPDQLEDHDAEHKRLTDHFTQYLKKCRAYTIPLKVDLPQVLDAHFAGVPPFGGGKKRNEFKDAFVLESLRAWNHDASPDPIYVVSQDKDFEKACLLDKHFLYVEKLEDVLSKAAVAADILENFKRAIIRQGDLFEALSKLAGRASIEHGYGGPEPTYQNVELSYLEIEDVYVIYRKDKTFSGTIDVTADFTVTLEWQEYHSEGWDERDDVTLDFHESVGAEGNLSIDFEATFDPDEEDGFLFFNEIDPKGRVTFGTFKGEGAHWIMSFPGINNESRKLPR